MDTEDIIESQEELLAQAQSYFKSWYEKEEELRQELTGESEEC